MKLFYGSKTLLTRPTFGEGNPSNDYGLGFYLTPERAMADLWAGRYDEGGYTIAYALDLNKLRVLTIADSSELAILQWITLLVKHRFSYQQRVEYAPIIDWLTRHFSLSLEAYDILVGYRADDAYFNYSLGFVAGRISLQTLAKAMKLGNLGLQYVLKSEAAFASLQFLDSTFIEPNDAYEGLRQKTLQEFHELQRNEDLFRNTFIGDLMKKYGP